MERRKMPHELEEGEDPRTATVDDPEHGNELAPAKPTVFTKGLDKLAVDVAKLRSKVTDRNEQAYLDELNINIQARARVS